jgi:hypothetical protein
MTEIVVTFFLIIVCMIVSTMLGALAFGAIGTYATPPEVSADLAGCTSQGGSVACSVSLTNQGAQSAYTEGTCSIGAGEDGTVTGGGVIPAGGTLTGVTCTVLNVTIPDGSRVVGTISLTDGYPVYFVGN